MTGSLTLTVPFVQAVQISLAVVAETVDSVHGGTTDGEELESKGQRSVSKE